MNETRSRFVKQANATNGNDISVLVVAVRLPHGAVETIINSMGLITKINWYLEKYDDDFRMIANPEIQIVGYILA